MTPTSLAARSMNGALRIVRRFGWGLGDQALSSLTNLALGVVVARGVSTEDFGAFNLALVVYLITLGIGRAVSSEPLVVRFSTAEPEEWRRATRATTATSILVGTIAGLGCLVVTPFMGEPLRTALPVLGVALPGLLLQDAWRFAFFAQHAGVRAFVNDLVWALLLFPGLIYLEAADRSTVGWTVLVWGASGSLAGLFGVLQTRILPNPALIRGWWRDHRDLGARFAGEFGLVSGSRQLGTIAISAIAGLGAVGAIRGAALLLGPLNILFAGLTLTLIPHSARVGRQSKESLLRLNLKVSSGMFLISAVFGLALLLIPRDLGVILLGRTWEPARAVLLALALMQALRGAALGPIVGLRALGAAKRSLRTQVIQAVLRLAAVLAGAALGGAPGAAWGFAGAAAVEGILWWRELRGELNAPQPLATPVEEEVQPVLMPDEGEEWVDPGPADAQVTESDKPPRPTTSDPGPKVLYIMGEDRSGSTILMNILGEIPGFFAGGEVTRLWESLYHGRGACGCGKPVWECPAWNRMLDELSATSTGPGGVAERMFRRELRLFSFYRILTLRPRRGKEARHRLPEAEAFMEVQRDLYRSIARVTGSRVIVDSSKLPTYGAMLSQTAGLRPYFVHLVRDARAVAYSSSKRKGRPDRGDELPVHGTIKSSARWIVRNVSSGAVRSSGAPFMRLRYRDFVGDPEGTVREIARFVDEPEADIGMFEGRTVTLTVSHTADGNPIRFGGGTVDIRQDDRWKTEMSTGRKYLVTLLTAPLLRAYGFPLRPTIRKKR